MKFFHQKKGTSMAEVLIAISIFAVAATVTSGLFFEVVKMQKRSTIENALYEDARLILQRMTYEIQNGTIDYEEYFNINVIQKNENFKYYGINYGAYGSRFYDPGKSLTAGDNTRNPDNLGIECSVGTPPECEVTYTLSTDLSTGQNPFSGTDKNRSNAFCDNNNSCKNVTGETGELYLLDNTGTVKTLIARKPVANDGTHQDYAIGMVRMKGFDIDQNGVVDTFSCFENYDCFDDFETVFPDKIFKWIDDAKAAITEYNLSLPRSDDLGLSRLFNPTDSWFVPFTPLDVNIKNLKFIISPVEDPYKAYAEDSMQAHPSVTIILTLALSEKAKKEYPGNLSEITVQTTVAAGIISGIPSYPSTNDLRWLKQLSLSQWP